MQPIVYYIQEGMMKLRRFVSGMKLKGMVSWKVLDKDGNVLQSGAAPNQIKTVGKAEVARLIGAVAGGTAFSALAIGTSATANDPAQQTLVAEITTGAGGRGAATVTNVTTTTTEDTVRFVKSWTFSAGFTIQEAGIFNNNTSGGDMLGRILIGPITVVSGNILQLQYDIIVG
ncbi:MAG: hypothetical protein WC350_05545 [Candidatus Micrarchaeia archaeon]|jgi:hypothetical protein